jgi:hypothetical protein
MKDVTKKMLSIAKDISDLEERIDEIYIILQDLYYEVPQALKDRVKKAMDILEE